MKTIYRFESKDVVAPLCSKVNAGAYNSRISHPLVEMMKDRDTFNRQYHPTPYDDGGLCGWYCDNSGVVSEYFFGFVSEGSLCNWFDVAWFMDEVEKLGIGRIGVYEVEDEYVIEGHYQAVFKASESRLVKVLPANHFVTAGGL